MCQCLHLGCVQIDDDRGVFNEVVWENHVFISDMEKDRKKKKQCKTMLIVCLFVCSLEEINTQFYKQKSSSDLWGSWGRWSGEEEIASQLANCVKEGKVTPQYTTI